MLGSILHAEHRQCDLPALRSVRRVGRLPYRSRPPSVLRLARLHQQFPEPGHLYYLQRRVPASLQAPAAPAVQPNHHLGLMLSNSHVIRLNLRPQLKMGQWVTG